MTALLTGEHSVVQVDHRLIEALLELEQRRIPRHGGEADDVETLSDVAADAAGAAEWVRGTVLDGTERVLDGGRIEDVLGALELVRLANEGIREADDLDEALLSVVGQICQGQGWEIGRVWRAAAEDAKEADLLPTAISYGPSAQPFPAPSLLALQALEHREPRARSQIAGLGPGASTESVGLAAPIVVDDQVQFVLEFVGDSQVKSDDVMIPAVQSVCAIVARRIDYRRTARLLREAQSHDPLTGLLTRGVFCEHARVGRSPWSGGQARRSPSSRSISIGFAWSTSNTGTTAAMPCW